MLTARRLLLASTLATSLLALTERPAAACDCSDSAVMAPQQVPKNAKLFFNAYFLGSLLSGGGNRHAPTLESVEAAFLIRLGESDGGAGLGGAGGQPMNGYGENIAESVRFDVTKITTDEGPSVFVLHPERELTPGQWQLAKMQDGVPWAVHSFEVTGEIDNVPPETPVLESKQTIEEYFGPFESTSCGDGPFLGVSLQYSGNEGFLLWDVTSDGKYADTALAGPMTLASSQSYLSFGEVACGVHYDDGSHLRVRVRRVDAAGNVSAWSDPVSADIPEEDACACSLPGAASRTATPAVLAFGLSAGLWLRRRRRAFS